MSTYPTFGMRQGWAAWSWRARRWFTEPFRLKVDIYEHTRVEHRAFPYRLRVSVVESLQERIDRGGMVNLERATFHLTQPAVVPGNTVLQGGVLRF